MAAQVCFRKETHVVELTQNTIEANARFFENEAAVPKKAITMGIGCIMAARRVLLVASGANKAEAVYRTLNEGISEECPATIKKKKKGAVLYLDRDSASLLNKEN